MKKKKLEDKSLLELFEELKVLDEQIKEKVESLKEFMVKENPELRYIS